MAEYEERSLEDLTEEPSPHRIEEMRQKGQVAQSRELTSTLIFFSALGVLQFSAKRFATDFTEYMKDIFEKRISTPTAGMDDGVNALAFTELLHRMTVLTVTNLLLFFGVVMSMAVLVSVAQTQGFIFTAEPIQLDLTRLNPIKGFQKIFSASGAQEGFKSVVKFLTVCGVLYYTIKGEIYNIPSWVSLSAEQILSKLGGMVIHICASVAGLMLIVSAYDYLVQWRIFRKQAMTTRAEAKQELKEREGDPQIKARIRSVQREMARKRMMKAVPKADVIITNPTHIAIAVVYDKDSLAPRVIAKGADFLAEKIRSLAKEHGIPMVENKILARTLYKTVKVGQMIPRGLYQAVAEILAYVYKIKPKAIFTEPEDHQN